MQWSGRIVESLLVPVALLLPVAFFALSGPVAERPQLLRLAGEDVTLRAENANAFARFHQHPNGMELHVLVHVQGEEGELLQARVVLSDTQTFRMRVGQEDEDVGAEFSFTRSGDEILAAVSVQGAGRSYAGLDWFDGFL